MPPKFKEMYDPEKISLPVNFAKQHVFPIGIEDIRDEKLASYPRTEKEVKRHIAEYYGMITHLDYEIGRVIEKLKEKEELEQTLIVLAGDNGLAVGCHGLMGKQNNYEHSIRVPLVFYGSGIEKGKKIEQYVYLYDIYPTLCSLFHFPIPRSVDGEDFSKMFEDSSFKIRKELYFAYGDLIRSAKDERYKLIQYRYQKERCQLFDLWEDPDEQVDLSMYPEYQVVIKRLKETMQKFRINWDEDQHILGKRYWDKSI